MNIETKQCKACWRVKPIGKFEFSHKSRDGLMTICADCRRMRSAAKEPALPPAQRVAVRRDDDAWVAEGWAMLRRDRDEICGGGLQPRPKVLDPLPE